MAFTTIWIIFATVLATSVFYKALCFDQRYRALFLEAQCQATCLSKFGISYNHTFRTGSSERRYRCVNDCEDCWNACTFSGLDCYSKCRRMKNSTTCRFGCDRLVETNSIVLSESEANATVNSNNTVLPVSSVRFLCMNSIPNEPPSVLGSFLVQLDEQPNTSHVFVYESRYKLYSLGIRDYAPSQWLTLGTRPSRNFALRNMFPSTQYQVRAFAIDSSGLLYPTPFYSPWIETLSEDILMKQPLSVRVVYQKPTSKGQMQACIEWKPDPLYPSCYYRLVWRDDDHIESRAFPIDEGFRYIIDNLRYSTEYTVMIRAIRDLKTGSPESPPIVTTFTTWSCLEANRFNFQICAPGVVGSLKVDVFENATAVVRWTPPAYVSVVNNLTNYLLRFRSLVHIGHCKKHVKELMEIPSDQTNLTISDLGSNCYYVVSIAATTKGGAGQELFAEFNFTSLDDPYYILERVNLTITMVDRGYEQLYALLLIPVSVLLTIGALIIYFKIRPRKSVGKKPIIDPHHIALKRVLERNQTYRCAVPLPTTQTSLCGATGDVGPYIKPIDLIGHGEFGCVYKAFCNRDGLPKVVAVKTLKVGENNPSAERNLEMEIELMQRMTEPHRNIVRFYGICLLNINGCTQKGLVMEHCSDGNLKDYLQHIREEHLTRMQRSNLSPTDSGYGAMEFTLPHTASSVVELSPAILPDVDPQLLLSYAWQVCCGMEHLSRQQLVHRDLAARNILVADKGRIVKISDFGLCRVGDLLGEYHLTSVQQSKLPIRWMAPEAVRTRVFSSQSDVWSFGIFLWELLTIGALPYPGYSCDQIPELLSSNYRMPKPATCAQEIYETMLACWQNSPNDRPDFAALRCKIENMLQNTEQRCYLELVDA